MKNHLIPVITFVILSLGLHAQQNDKQQKAKAESARLMALYHKLEGTYQVQVIDSREKVGFPLSALDSVQAKRKENETVYFWLKHNIRVMVPSNTEIRQKSFAPLAQTAYYSSNNLPGKK